MIISEENMVHFQRWMIPLTKILMMKQKEESAARIVSELQRQRAGMFDPFYPESIYLENEGKYWQAPYMLLCSYCELGSQYVLCDECYNLFKEKKEEKDMVMWKFVMSGEST